MFHRARRFRGIALFTSSLGIAALLATTLFALPPKEKDNENEKAPRERTSKEEKRRQKAIQKEMEDPYKRWLTDEVPTFAGAATPKKHTRVLYKNQCPKNRIDWTILIKRTKRIKV